MGTGKLVNGRHQPITPWRGSWAQMEEERRQADARVREARHAPDEETRHAVVDVMTMEEYRLYRGLQDVL